METPTICASGYTASALNYFDNENQTIQAPQWQSQWGLKNAAIRGAFQSKTQQQTVDEEIESMANTTQRRIVQVFIADPNDNVPLENSILYKGEQKLTDLNDNELFFEIPMAETLKAHNDKRVKWLDKEASKRAGKDLFLEPAKIRDLKMLVVTIAAF